MKNELVIFGETTSIIKYATMEELQDKFRGISREMQIPLTELGLLKIKCGPGAARQMQDIMDGGYPDHVVVTDGDATPTVYNTMAGVYGAAQVAAGVEARIWEHTVLPRYIKAWGHGILGTINNQGYLFFALLKVTTAFQSGTVKLIIESNDRNIKSVIDAFADDSTHLADKTSLLTATPTNNQTGMRALPRSGKCAQYFAQQYSRLCINYQVKTAQATLDSVGFRIPVFVKTY